MRIAVLGSGQVGRALGAGLARHGHDVVMGTRDPGGASVTSWVAETGAHATAGTYADAAAECELACVATAWGGTENAISLAGADNLDGKVVIDVTNPLGFGPDGPFLVIGNTDSAGQQVQRWLPGSRVVKAWNTVNSAHMIDPNTPGGPADMFICGNDAAAKQVVTELLAQCGWSSVIDTGGIAAAAMLESLALLWVAYAREHQSTSHAFRLLRA